LNEADVTGGITLQRYFRSSMVSWLYTCVLVEIVGELCVMKKVAVLKLLIDIKLS